MKILDSIPSHAKDYFLIIFGSLIFVVGVNFFIVPMGLYNGGIVGGAQLIRTILARFWQISFSFDIAGIINMALNIPLLFLAYKNFSRKFFIGTMLSLVIQTIGFSFIPIPSQALVGDVVANIVVGAIISGAGLGIILLGGASSGGIDIIAVYSSVKKPSISVGGLSMAVNFMVYVICAVLFKLEIAIYSIVYAGIVSFGMDYFHYQNIEMSLMVFTKNIHVKDEIMNRFERGVTYWKGVGAYTKNDVEVFVTACSKYEAIRIKKMIQQMDPQAFIIMNSTNITGGFEKRLG